MVNFFSGYSVFMNHDCVGCSSEIGRDFQHERLAQMTFLNLSLLLTRTAKCSFNLHRFHYHTSLALHTTMASASQSALLKLHSPLKELVAGAVQEGSPDFGRTEKDQADVAGWIEIVAAGNQVKPDTLQASFYCSVQYEFTNRWEERIGTRRAACSQDIPRR